MPWIVCHNNRGGITPPHLIETGLHSCKRIRVDEAVQFGAQARVWAKDAGPNGVCKVEGTVVNYRRDQVPETRKASHII